MSEDRTRPNRALRILVPLAIVLAGVGIFYLTAIKGSQPATPKSADPAALVPGANPDAASTAGTLPPRPESAPKATDLAADSTGKPAPEQATTIAAPARELRAKRFPAQALETLGDLTPAPNGTFHMQLEFSPFGAGLSSLRLANHFEHVDRVEHEVIQRFVGLNGSDRIGTTPMAAAFVNIDGVDVDLSLDQSDPAVTLWRQVAPGSFEAIITERTADATETDLARISRRFILLPGSYEFTLEQSFENLSGRPLKIVWNQYGPSDLPLGTIRYGGDVRRVRFGYLMFPTDRDPDRNVLGSKYRIPHETALGKPDESSGQRRWVPTTLWPDAQSQESNLGLSWLGMTSRYFAVAMHPVPSATTDLSKPIGQDKSLSIVERVDRIAIPAPIDPTATGHRSLGSLILRTASPQITIPPGAKSDLSMLVYAGPLSKPYIEAEPPAAFYGLEELVIFTFGGPCAFCTFQPVAIFLRWFLGFLHDWVLFDWALAIMLLVVCVRGCLHPLTRWSQLSMLRFSKQMQALAPKQRAIQERYKNDPTKMREESTRLMREEHVDYSAAMKGCLPSFMQMPIWIALYAMIFFTFELRHEAAFYGVIQSLTGGRWTFLADLAEPDNFISFRHYFGWNGISIPLISGLMGPIDALNILPLLLGVVFYIQQKYMQPPQTNMTPEQEQQQKIMKVMMVVMFPVFMYNAPAALSLYFMVNSSLGILESKWIRAHADELEKRREAHAAAGVGTSQFDRKGRERAKDARKPGLFARLQAEVERRQKTIEEQKRQASKKNRKP